jgi:uncharacterized repeat protein (TIGR04138 family)
MLDPAIARLLEEDRRYPLEAYIFVFEALNYAQNVLGMGSRCASEPVEPPEAEPTGAAGETADFRFTDPDEAADPRRKEEHGGQRHVTGQELCEAVRRFALEQYGYMARTVLANWGIHATADVGELVFNLIRIRQMRKTPHDRREDFHEVYDFKTALQEGFRFTPSEPPPPGT